jgi:hypothetical protein
MIFLQGFIKLDQGISEKCVGQTFDGRKKERKKKNNNNNKKWSKHNMSPKLSLGNIINNTVKFTQKNPGENTDAREG